MSVQQILASFGAEDSPGNDPFWANVVSLLHFDGPNGSTSFPDEAGSAWDAISGPTVTTAQSRFGGASVSFGAGYLTKTAGTAFTLGTGDFTIELWINRTDVGVVFDDRFNGLGAGMAIYVPNGTKNLVFFANGADRITYPSYGAGTFRHVAISRVSGVTRMFVNGVIAGSYTDTNDYLATTWRMGAAFNGTVNFTGFVDDFRATKGVGRYTTDFTPPSSAFPNS